MGNLLFVQLSGMFWVIMIVWLYPTGAPSWQLAVVFAGVFYAGSILLTLLDLVKATRGVRLTHARDSAEVLDS